MLAKITIPVEAGNTAINDGSLPKTVQSMLDELKPEAAYFSAADGQRTAFIFFDLKDASDMPVVAEPWFMNMNASVEFIPVMNPDELKAGLGKLAAGGTSKT